MEGKDKIVSITFNTAKIWKFKLLYFDAKGHLILEKEQTLIYLSIHKIQSSSGMYFIEVINKADRAVFTVVKQN